MIYGLDYGGKIVTKTLCQWTEMLSLDFVAVVVAWSVDAGCWTLAGVGRLSLLLL